MTEELLADPEDMPTEDEASAQDLSLVQVVAFYLNSQRYAIPIDRIQEIQQIVAFSEMPAGSDGVVGMVNLRGQVIPAVDVRQLVGLPHKDYSLETPMVICRLEDRLIALVVDEVQDVLDTPVECMQEPPGMHSLSTKLLGVARLADGLVYVLDIDSLLAGACA